MELKTLEDIEEIDRCSNCSLIGKKKCVREDSLRKEAIKWVKEYCGEYKTFKKYGYKYHRSKIFLMWTKFFNITEEDLNG